MSLKLSKIVTTNNYQRHFYRSLFSHHQNVNKTNNVYQIVNLYKRNEDRSSFSVLSKHHCRTTLCYPVGSLYINFQKRNASNDVSTIRDFEKMYDTSAQYTPDNATQLAEATNMVGSKMVYSTWWNVSDWKIVECAQNVFLKIHEITGLPWWASIALTALTAKTVVTLPFALLSIHNTAKLKSIEPKLEEAGKKLTREMNYEVNYRGWPESLAKIEYKKRIRKEYKDLIVEYNCHPAKSYILLLVQLPLWFSFSVAARNLCSMLPHQDIAAKITFMELSAGGFGWVKNLTLFDPYMVLPFAIGFINIIILELYNTWRLTPPTKFDTFRTYLFRFGALVIIIVGANMPAAVNVYWLASSSFGFGQAFLMQSPRLRRFLGMPLDRPELEHPYRHLCSSLKSRLRVGAE